MYPARPSDSGDQSSSLLHFYHNLTTESYGGCGAHWAKEWGINRLCICHCPSQRIVHKKELKEDIFPDCSSSKFVHREYGVWHVIMWLKWRNLWTRLSLANKNLLSQWERNYHYYVQGKGCNSVEATIKHVLLYTLPTS